MGIKKTWLRRLKQSSQVFFRLLLRGIASATSTAIHHGFHLLGIQAVGSVQRADGVLQLLERDQRGALESAEMLKALGYITKK